MRRASSPTRMRQGVCSASIAATIASATVSGSSAMGTSRVGDAPRSRASARTGPPHRNAALAARCRRTATRSIPGCTERTRMPKCATSSRSVQVRPSSANFDERYAPILRERRLPSERARRLRSSRVRAGACLEAQRGRRARRRRRWSRTGRAVGVADLLHRSLDPEAGIVDEDVDRTARPARRRRPPRRGHPRRRLDAVALSASSRSVARSRKHARPRGGQRARRRAADAGRAPVTRQVVPVSSRTCRGGR